MDERPKGVYSASPGTPGALDYPHPDNVLRVLFRSESGNNDEAVQQPRIRQADRAGRRRADSTRPCRLYNQAQEILVDDAPAVFTRWRISNYESPAVGLRRPRDTAGLREHGDLFPETIQISKH